MKLKKLIYLAGCLFIAVSSCTDDDNYDGPNAVIKGKVIDNITNKPIETEQPNGMKIRMYEKAYASPTPVDFWVRADGTFENAAMFAGLYSVVPFDGPFFASSVTAKDVDVQGTTEVTFTVTPILNIAATVTTATGSITAKYRISRTMADPSASKAKIIESKLLVSSIPTVNNAVFDVVNSVHKISAYNFTGSATGTSPNVIPATPKTDTEILGMEHTNTVSGLQSGKTYYARVAARTQGVARYNYSPVFKVIVP